jgi:hypothetical protein
MNFNIPIFKYRFRLQILCYLGFEARSYQLNLKRSKAILVPGREGP